MKGERRVNTCYEIRENTARLTYFHFRTRSKADTATKAVVDRRWKDSVLPCRCSPTMSKQHLTLQCPTSKTHCHIQRPPYIAVYNKQNTLSYSTTTLHCNVQQTSHTVESNKQFTLQCQPKTHLLLCLNNTPHCNVKQNLKLQCLKYILYTITSKKSV